MSLTRWPVALLAVGLIGSAAAHEHHEDNIPEGEGVSPDPIVGLFQRRALDARILMDCRTRYCGRIF